MRCKNISVCVKLKIKRLEDHNDILRLIRVYADPGGFDSPAAAGSGPLEIIYIYIYDTFLMNIIAMVIS